MEGYIKKKKIIKKKKKKKKKKKILKNIKNYKLKKTELFLNLLARIIILLLYILKNLKKKLKMKK